ncbi:phosphate regulon sensor protein PhoR [Marinibactrum halimedae]|uniref:histidine kinase n=2 Tax=Marinibactrum halimedae TaxID=1444977 RepID=A0AA37TB84_9GAMM|nr:phosphate regulon sensor protein PhoR [Marinibactrum halimedae]
MSCVERASSWGHLLQRGFASEIRRIGLLVVISTVLGLMTGYLLYTLLVMCVGYIGWALFQMRRLDLWLNSRRHLPPPDANGVWGAVFDKIYRLRRRQQSEKRRLQELIVRIQETTTALKDAVILLDKNASIEWWNQSARRLIRLQPGDHGQPLFNYIRSPKFIRYFEKGNFKEPLTIQSSLDSEIFLNFQISQFGQGEYLIVIRDISRLHKLEMMRKDFIGNVSHELRTPLTVVRGYLETMSDNADHLPAIWSKAIGQMQEQTERMTLLIEDLLMLSKLETEASDQNQHPVHVEALLNKVQKDASELSGERLHRIEVELQDSFDILGVTQELRSCISNLAFNAVRYSPPESQIILRARREEEYVYIDVQDHGIGIEAKHLPRITERFYRVDASRSLDTGGTGLGLAIVKHVLSRHNGQLVINSKLNKGSTFSCQFPITRAIEKNATESETVNHS